MTSPLRWQVAAASVRGSLHLREHLPNQDAVRTWVSDDGTTAVVAVADGHGHHDHFRSDVGAELAADVGISVLRDALRDAVDSGPDALDDVVAAVVEAWDAAIAEHLEEHPFGAGERPHDVRRPYGTTLLLAAVTGDHLVTAQIGDGDLVAVPADSTDPAGEPFHAVDDDPDSSDGVHTASLCQPHPAASFRTAVHPAADLALVYVCTDGFGKARVDAGGWWRETGTQLADLLAEHGPDWVAERLPGWLEEPARIGGDDTSLALIARSAPAR